MEHCDVLILVDIQKQILELRYLINQMDDRQRASDLLLLLNGFEQCARDVDEIQTLNIHSLSRGERHEYRR